MLPVTPYLAEIGMYFSPVFFSLFEYKMPRIYKHETTKQYHEVKASKSPFGSPKNRPGETGRIPDHSEGQQELYMAGGILPRTVQTWP